MKVFLFNFLKFSIIALITLSLCLHLFSLFTLSLSLIHFAASLFILHDLFYIHVIHIYYSFALSCSSYHISFSSFALINSVGQISEAIRELSGLQNKKDLKLAVDSALIVAHERCELVGM